MATFGLERRGRLRTKAIAALLAGIMVAGVFVLAVAARGNGAFTVTSSLDGKTALPHRIHWTATPKLPAAKVSEVAFLIDGKVRWIEHKPPYAFGDDGNWLVTSWLTPGKHHFTVRVKDSQGRIATDAITATVSQAPAPPPQLDGTRWSRAFTKAEVGDGPAGTWKVAIDRTGWKIKDPTGGANFVDVAYRSTGLLEARGGIWTRLQTAAEQANGGLHTQEGNGWCGDTNQPVRYHWTVRGTTLTLTLAGPKRCDGQSDIWARTWTRLP